MAPRTTRWIVACCFLFVASLPLSAAAQVRPDPGTGALQAIAPDGKVTEFPLQHTSADMAVSGLLVRATVTQTFSNPFGKRIEAVYVFPLPEDGAVDDMTMQIGSRTIRGKIKERQEANRIYQEAKQQGKTASLLTQERPNLFTQSVANILPGDVIRIVITYVAPLKYEAGTVSMAFPMVVGPRYIPGAQTHPDGSVTGHPAIPDADRITPPVLRPGERNGHDIAVTVGLDAGVPFTNLRSPSHRLVSTVTGPRTAVVRLAPEDTIPNKDFILRWDVRPERVATGLLAHRSEAGGYFSLTMVPAVDPRPAEVTPKEMVFLLDCSGSMSGNPIEQAKTLVRHALGKLNPEDTFLILNFSNSASGLAPLPLPNTPENVRRGVAYVNSLHGEGGTEMITGIRAALDLPADPQRVRQVMFLTDGYIGNETQILDAVRQKIGGARLFSFGVGSSVNRYLLENLALEGRGAVQYVRYDEDAKAPVERFYDQIRSPYLTDVEIDWAGLQVKDLYPARLPDLFTGHPLVVTGRFDRGGQAIVTVRGRIAGEAVAFPIQVSLPDVEYRNPVLRTLWARQAIEDRMRQMLRGEAPALVKDVIDLSVTHRVLSQYTAFVAVEERARTNERGEPVKVEVPVETPDGVDFQGVFGGDEDATVARGASERKAKASVGARAYGGGMGLLQAPRPSAPPPAAGSAGMGFQGVGKGGGGSAVGYGRISAHRGSAAALSVVTSSVSGRPGPAKEAADKAVPRDAATAEKALVLTLAVTQSADTAAANKVLKPLLPALKKCIAAAQASGSKVPDSIVVRLVADATGHITAAKVETAGLEESVKFCLERMFRGTKMPGAGVTVVRLAVTSR